MASALAAAARQELLAFARQDRSLTDLYSWLADHVVATQAESQDSELRETLGHTILYLYEYQDGYRSKEEIREYIVGLLSPVVLQT